MFSKLPPVVQESLVMAAGAGLGVLASNPTPSTLLGWKSLGTAVIGAIFAAEVAQWRKVVTNWLTQNATNTQTALNVAKAMTEQGGK